MFDYYERAHLNHVMAAQNPKDAGFSYMTPLMTGTARDYSTPKDDVFWCCVGTGKVATQHLEADQPGKFFDVDYPLPIGLTKGKASVKVRFMPHDRSSAGPVFGVRMVTAKAGVAA